MPSHQLHAITSRHPPRLAMFEMPSSWMPDIGGRHLKMTHPIEQHRDGVGPEQRAAQASVDDRKHEP
jgi:hypothetical protein